MSVSKELLSTAIRELLVHGRHPFIPTVANNTIVFEHFDKLYYCRMCNAIITPGDHFAIVNFPSDRSHPDFFDPDYLMPINEASGSIWVIPMQKIKHIVRTLRLGESYAEYRITAASPADPTKVSIKEAEQMAREYELKKKSEAKITQMLELKSPDQIAIEQAESYEDL